MVLRVMGGLSAAWVALCLAGCGAEGMPAPDDRSGVQVPPPVDPNASVTPTGSIGMVPATDIPGGSDDSAASRFPSDDPAAAGAGAPPPTTGEPPVVENPPVASGACCTDGNCFCRGDDPTEISASQAGPFSFESYSQGFSPGAGVTSHTVWYPVDAEPPFAGIAIVPGFVSPESSISDWGPFLASHGIVAVTIGVPGGDQPPTRASKLMTTVDGIIAEHTRTGSPLEGKLDVTRMAVAGWSMGGGGAMIAASENPQLSAAIGFAAWGPRGAAANQVPALMFEATADILAANMSDGHYAMIPASVPKMLFEVQGSSHNVANAPENHDGIIGRYGLSWLKVFMEGDERYRQFLTAGFPSIATAKSDTNVQ